MPGIWKAYKYLKDLTYKPTNHYFFLEDKNGYIILMRADNENYIDITTDEGETWDHAHITSPDRQWEAFSYDSENEYTCAVENFKTLSSSMQFERYHIPTDSNQSSNYGGGNYDMRAHDCSHEPPWVYGLTSCYIGGTPLYVEVRRYNFSTWTWDTSFGGSIIADWRFMGERFLSNWVRLSSSSYYFFVYVPSWDCVKLYQFNGSSISLVKAFASGTETPPLEQAAIAYDGNDILSTILYDGGTKETFTIVAVVPGSISDGTYITFQLITAACAGPRAGKRELEDYYLWFDKVGDQSGDPAPSGYTEICVDISGASTAQDVSNEIRDAIRYAWDTNGFKGQLLADNGSGTSTTVTCELIFAGNVDDAVDVDSGLTVTVTQQGVASTPKYYSYSISDDSYISHGTYDLVLMRENLTQSFEKGFSTSENNIYQIGRNRLFSKIAYLTDEFVGATIGTLLAISDNYLIDEDSQLFEYTNCIDDLFAAVVEMSSFDADEASVATSIIFPRNQAIQLYDPDGVMLFNGLVNARTDVGKNYYEYDCRSFNREAHVKSFEDDLSDVTTKNAKNIIEHLVDTHSINVYYDNSIDSDFTTVYAGLDFKSSTLANALDTLMDYEDGFWWIDGDGKLNAYKIANIPQHPLLYPGYYTFENDTDDANPSGWTVGESGSTHIQVKPYNAGHLKPVEIWDNGWSDSCYMYNNFSANQDNGSFGYWVKFNRMSTADAFVLSMDNSVSTTLFTMWINHSLYFGAGTIWLTDESSALDITLAAEEWYFFRFDFNTSGTYLDVPVGKYRIWINNEDMGLHNLASSANPVKRIQFSTSTSQTGNSSYIYLDSIIYSWELSGDRDVDDGYYSMSPITKKYFDYGITGTPKVREITSEINKVTLYGAIVKGYRLQTEAGYGEDTNSILLNGEYEYYDHFPSCTDQDELNDLSDAILNRTGIATNPVYITRFGIFNNYAVPGRTLRCSLPGYYNLQEPERYYVTSGEVDVKNDLVYLNMSSGLTHEKRSEQVQATKTSTADEEQIDILATDKVETLIESTNPSASDDEYPVGTQWYNTSNSRLYICVDNTASAAVWKYVTLT